MDVTQRAHFYRSAAPRLNGKNRAFHSNSRREFPFQSLTRLIRAGASAIAPVLSHTKLFWATEARFRARRSRAGLARHRLLLCGAALLCAGVLAAQEAPPEPPASPEASASPEAAIVLPAPSPESAITLSPSGGAASSAWSLLKGVLALALVAAGAYGVVFFIKRTRRGAFNENPRLRVLASAPINARAQVAVVAVGNKAFLLGVGESAVSLVAELDDKETVDALMLDYAREGGAVTGRLSFKAMLSDLGVRASGATDTASPSAALDAARNRLKAL